MKTFEASTTIRAPRETIWQILLDASAYPEWDPSCDKIEGVIALGSKLKAFCKLSPGRGFGVRVTELVQNERMTWQGGMPLGLFKGVRTFALEPSGDAVRFTVREVFTGPMLALFGGTIPDMNEAFAGFAAGLKARAEASRA
jgi:hypothetical protein